MLKNKIHKISEEEKQEIVDNLLQNGKIQVGQLINYEYFQGLYQPYAKQMSESEFASLLDINYTNYKSVKSRRNKCKSVSRYCKKSYIYIKKRKQVLQ